jgi:hypothetical protein
MDDDVSDALNVVPFLTVLNVIGHKCDSFGYSRRSGSR